MLTQYFYLGDHKHKMFNLKQTCFEDVEYTMPYYISDEHVLFDTNMFFVANYPNLLKMEALIEEI